MYCFRYLTGFAFIINYKYSFHLFASPIYKLRISFESRIEYIESIYINTVHTICIGPKINSCIQSYVVKLRV
jgi:hypothetical protein